MTAAPFGLDAEESVLPSDGPLLEVVQRIIAMPAELKPDWWEYIHNRLMVVYTKSGHEKRLADLRATMEDEAKLVKRVHVIGNKHFTGVIWIPV